MRLNSLAASALLLGNDLDRRDSRRHRHRAVLALSRRRGARIRSPARRLPAHAGRRRCDAGGERRQVSAIHRRAAVRSAALRLVLAGDTARSRRRPTCARPARCGMARCRISPISVPSSAPAAARAGLRAKAPRRSSCASSSAPSISARRGAISLRSPATPPRSTRRHAASTARWLSPSACWRSCCC